jgi:N-acetylglucosamine malate deacetylase 1
MNVVCMAAHQDDEMGCLGTLLKYRQAGHRLAFVVVTNGDRGMSWSSEVPLEEAAAIRDREMAAVAAALDAAYRCLGEPDEFLFETAELRLRAVDVLRELRADLLFTHWTSDYNADHEATARLACQAALLAEIASIATAHAPLERAPGIFHMDPGEGHGFDGTHFVELSEELAIQKAQLIRLHASQMDVMRELRGQDYADLMLARDRLHGARAMVAYAETFRPCLAERRIPLARLLP